LSELGALLRAQRDAAVLGLRLILLGAALVLLSRGLRSGLAGRVRLSRLLGVLLRALRLALRWL
jgi:hypothetical protein